MKLSEYVMRFLEKQGVSTVFLLSGGGAMHLVDSLGKSRMKYVPCHHEQAAGIAAQAFAMYDETLGACLVTTGPGGTNALTALAAAYVDSSPVLFLSGQVKTADFASKRGVRQFGAQENDIVAMAKPVAKYAVTVTDPASIRYHLERAAHEALAGRKGPVWLDIPLDVQSAEIDENALAPYVPEAVPAPDFGDVAQKTYELLNQAKRPLILAGRGILAAGARQEFLELQEALGIPVVCSWRAVGLMGADDPLFFGSPGLQAPRYANLITQSCDFLLVFGSRLDNMITAFSESHFAFRAKKVVVDIDPAEIDKLDMPDVLKVYGDVGGFVGEILRQKSLYQKPDFSKWIADCHALKARFPLLAEPQPAKDGVDLYRVADALSAHCTAEDTVVVSSTSRCNTAGHIAFRHKAGQRSISSMGFGSMGFALPSAVGAYYAAGAGERRVVMLEGDGSLQLNLQELQTIETNRIPAKMFIFTNNGYAAIKTTQMRTFTGNLVGSTPESGVEMPPLQKIAAAYGIMYYRICSDDEIEMTVRAAMEYDGAVLVDIMGSLDFDEIPKCVSSTDENGKIVSAALENAFPFMPEAELDAIFAEITGKK